MSKKTLPEDHKLSDLATYETEPDALVEQAADWAEALWRRADQLDGESRERAMRTAANWARVTPNTIWKLRYRKPRDIGASIYFRLKAAHQKHVASVEGKLAENLIALRALPATPDRQRLVADLEKFLGIAPGEAPRAPAQSAD